jgi:hypothetical protein
VVGLSTAYADAFVFFVVTKGVDDQGGWIDRYWHEAYFVVVAMTYLLPLVGGGVGAVLAWRSRSDLPREAS